MPKPSSKRVICPNCSNIKTTRGKHYFVCDKCSMTFSIQGNRYKGHTPNTKDDKNKDKKANSKGENKNDTGKSDRQSYKQPRGQSNNDNVDRKRGENKMETESEKLEIEGEKTEKSEDDNYWCGKCDQPLEPQNKAKYCPKCGAELPKGWWN